MGSSRLLETQTLAHTAACSLRGDLGADGAGDPNCEPGKVARRLADLLRKAQHIVRRPTKSATSWRLPCSVCTSVSCAHILDK